MDEFFGPDGVLARKSEEAGFAFEYRDPQRQMACAVGEALDGAHPLIVEAGTGVGKSFAYLVPAAMHALRTKTKAIISTHTISLQEQLVHKDIPFIHDRIGIAFKAVLVKGLTNYLCLRRLARATGAKDLLASNKKRELDRLRGWAQDTADGSLQDLAEQPDPEVWDAVSVEHGNCLWTKCPEYKQCFYIRARQAMRTADVLVVNHHLFFADLNLRAQGAELLPPATAVVLDEAHTVEAVAGDHLGIRLSQLGLERWIRRVYAPETGKGLLTLFEGLEPRNLAMQFSLDLEDLITAIQDWADLKPDRAQRVIPAPQPFPREALATLDKLAKLLQEIGDADDNLDRQAEFHSAARRGREIGRTLADFLDQSLEDQVYWVAREGARRPQLVLYSAPIEVAPTLEETLFNRPGSLVMTSATLAVQGSMDYFARRVGGGKAAAVQVGSPFDYARQMRILVARGMPDPGDEEKYPPACAAAVRRFVDESRGRAFVLFTSDRLMKKVAAQVQDHCTRRGYDLFVQGAGLTRSAMLNRFRASPAGVLFGLDSFWQGVDVPGEALSNVIITKLPFAVPDDPLTQARIRRIEEQGGNAFSDYTLPEAVIRLRQGVGRLIRTATDRGTIVLLDPRVLTKRYGRTFLESLPECEVEIVDLRPPREDAL